MDNRHSPSRSPNSADTRQRFAEASVGTANELSVIARSALVRDLSSLSLPEIDTAVDLVSKLIPAGNVPAMILSGLARLGGCRPPLKTVKRDIGLLFQGAEKVLDHAVYAAFFAGPAAVIWGYQQLLKLAGINPEDSFPEGTWQFYVEHALREDTARHANETHGFDSLLAQYGLQLSAVDRITAWAMAAIYCLHQYGRLLENEWRENVYPLLLRQAVGEGPGGRYSRLHAEWSKVRPYGRGADAPPEQDYPAYRRAVFDRFLAEATRELGPSERRQWQESIRRAEAAELPAYQRQLSILAYLEPGPYDETRVPVPLNQACVGLIYGGGYSMLPACTPGTDQPPEVETVRAQVAALMGAPPGAASPALAPWAAIKRAHWPELRAQLDDSCRRELERLRRAPILLNCDARPADLPLAQIRQGERGLGDHAMTIFDAGTRFVLDESHIFFDGVWGTALAEILTTEALSWAVYLNSLPPACPAGPPPQRLALRFRPQDVDRLRAAPRATPEADAETSAVNLRAILRLRQTFKKRSDSLQLTVNDLLILYRAIHAAAYRPSLDLVTFLQTLERTAEGREAALAALEAVNPAHQDNPAILIPVDASQRSPRDRLFPLAFEVPLGELDLLGLHEQTVAALEAVNQGSGDHAAAHAHFDQLQRTYLGTLAGFGAVMARAKEIATSGESTSVGAIKLLARMPAPLQRLLEEIPSRFDVLNDIIKGSEVFSNVGAVAPTSTLTRFITAKDDNEQKVMAWGVLTDAQGVLRITLRDFRPHVALLQAAGQGSVATRIAQEYLDRYAHGLNAFVRDLLRITVASRETQPERPKE